MGGGVRGLLEVPLFVALRVGSRATGGAALWQ